MPMAPGMWGSPPDARTPNPTVAQNQQPLNPSQGFQAPFGAFPAPTAGSAPSFAAPRQNNPAALEEWMAGALQASNQLPLQPFGPPATHPAFPWGPIPVSYPCASLS